MKPPSGHRALGPLSFIAVAMLAVSVAWAAPTPGRTFVVVMPSGPKDLKTVAPYLNRFLDYLEKHEKVATGTYNAYYHSTLAKGESALLKKKPGFAMLSLGLYLKHRDALNMKVVAGLEIDGKADARFHVVSLAADLKGKGLAAVKGKRLAWSRFDDMKFVNAVLLEGHDIGTHFTEVAVAQPVQAVRALISGEADVALLKDDELAAAKKIAGAEGMVVVYSPAPIPYPPVVALGDVASAEDIAGIGKALRGMCADKAGTGAAICKDFDISRFAPATAKKYAAVAKRYAAR